MSGIEIKGQVGEQALSAGAHATLRQGRFGEVVGSNYLPRLAELTRAGRLFSNGMGLTTINNATYTTGTLSATCTPIAGVWNPPTSGVDLIIIQLIVGVTVTAATNTGAAPFAWASSIGNAAISTGSQPFNRKTGAASGSSALGFANVALTGLTNNLVVRGAAGVCGGSMHGFSFVETAVGSTGAHHLTVDNVDGAIVVPPGGVLACLATTTPVAHSASSMLLWAEVPV